LNHSQGRSDLAAPRDFALDKVHFSDKLRDESVRRLPYTSCGGAI
jgi:hypothetical protein